MYDQVKEVSSKMKSAATAYARGEVAAAKDHAKLNEQLMLEIAAAAVRAHDAKRAEIEAKGKRLIEVGKEAEQLQAQNVKISDSIKKLKAEIKALESQRGANNATHHNKQKERNMLERFAESNQISYDDPDGWAHVLTQAGNEARAGIEPITGA